MNDNFVIKDLFAHMQWADTEVWKVVEGSPNVENDKKIKSLLYHTHLVQFLFLKIWKKEKIDYPKENEFKSLSEIKDWSTENYNEINNFFNDFDENRFEEIAHIPWVKIFAEKFGIKPGQVTIIESMLQVVTHTTYHRAQVNMKLSELGYAPPSVDYIIWLWSGKPTSG